jgi:hypothetical protein
MAALGIFTTDLFVPMALAQPANLSRETIGGTLPVNNNMVTNFSGYESPRHLNANNKPCLTVSPIYKKQGLNPSLFDQILLLDNQCAQTIQIRACYYRTSSCTIMRVGPYQRQQHNLGISTTPDFRYSFREYGEPRPLTR